MFERTFSFWRRLVGLAERPLPAKPVASDAGDRRVWLRHPADLETTYHPAQDGSRPLGARVRDISRGGIHLLVQRPFDTGELLSIELPTDIDQEPLTVLACIVRVQEENEGEFSLGCVFSRELSDEDLQRFGARRERPAPSDERTWMRFPCSVTATYQKTPAEDSAHLPAQLLNISANGVGLEVEQSVETGTLLSLDFHPKSGKPGRTMLACVVHVTAQSSGIYALGCNFIRELSEDDLQALLK